jgi:hypothetical protein
VVVVSNGSGRGDTAITVIFGAVLVAFLVWRWRRRDRKRFQAGMQQVSLMQSWQAYNDGCVRAGQTPLDFEQWQSKGRAWILCMKRIGVSRDPLDFDQWMAAGEPAE